MKDKLIVLDLDETLLYSTTRELDSERYCVVGPYNVYLRPDCEEFIEYCVESFESVAVWTSSSEDYAAEIVENVFSGNVKYLKFVWSRARCTLRFNRISGEQVWLKNLDKIKKRGFLLEKTLMIDNTPEKLQRHYGNLIKVQDFVGDSNDNELSVLMKYLEIIGNVENVRVVEKRGWKSHTKLLNSN